MHSGKKTMYTVCCTEVGESKQNVFASLPTAQPVDVPPTMSWSWWNPLTVTLLFLLVPVVNESLCAGQLDIPLKWFQRSGVPVWKYIKADQLIRGLNGAIKPDHRRAFWGREMEAKVHLWNVLKMNSLIQALVLGRNMKLPRSMVSEPR